MTDNIVQKKIEFSANYMPLIRSDLTVTEIEDELIVLDQENGNVHQLNNTAAHVYQLCDGATNVQTIQASVLEYFDVEPDKALNDVRDLISMFYDNHLLKT